ncbi:MAG: SH3 domain-containing protein [Chloroflexota bacterium]
MYRYLPKLSMAALVFATLIALAIHPPLLGQTQDSSTFAQQSTVQQPTVEQEAPLLVTATSTPDPQDQCRFLVNEMSQAIGECSDINTNWTCYGKFTADVVPIKYRYHAVKDRQPLKKMRTLDTDDKGIVFMNLLAQGETDPMTAMLFGDALIESKDKENPDFLFWIDDTGPLCKATVPGMIIQTKSGKRGRIKVNGVTLKMRSAAFVTMESDQSMSISNISEDEGQVIAEVNGRDYVIPVGQYLRIIVNNGVPVRVILPLEASPYADSFVLNYLVTNSNGLKEIKNSNEVSTDEVSSDEGVSCIGEVGIGDSFEDEMTNSGHECIYEICTEPGQTLTVNMEAIDTFLNPWIDLRDSAGFLLAFNNDISEANPNSILCNVPLPSAVAGPSCYSIIARSHHNESAGKFRLTIDGQTTCQMPEPRCEVMARWLNFRDGPSVQNAVLQVLPQNTHLKPVTDEAVNGWLNVTYNGQSGWVNTDPRFLLCEGIYEPNPPGCSYYHHGLPGEDRPHCNPIITVEPDPKQEVPTPLPTKNRPLPGNP